MKKGMKWAVLLCALLMLPGCAQQAEREAPQLLEPMVVQSDLAKAYIGDIYRGTYYSASVKPYVEGLSFEVGGQVMSVDGYPGMIVEEGDTLITLEQTSLQERGEGLRQEISYIQQDGKYSNEITELEIEILETELLQLEENEKALKKQETELKEKETGLRETEAELKEKETELKEKETALKEQEALLQERASAAEESEAASEESGAETEESETADEEDELLQVQEDLAQIAKDLETTAAELTKTGEDMTKTAEELAKAAESLAQVKKDIALKENEIEQKKALFRQEKERRALDLNNKQKELNEINESLDVTVLRAPFAGRVVYGDTLSPGAWVQAEDPVVYLADDSRLTVVCEYIPEGAIQRADRIFAHIGDREYELKYVPIDLDEYISQVSSGAEVTTKFEVIGTEQELAEIEAGQFAVVGLWSDYVRDVLLVPSGAVLKDAVGKYVYVDEDGKKVKRMVETDVTTDALTQITEGLVEGDVVYVQE